VNPTCIAGFAGASLIAAAAVAAPLDPSPVVERWTREKAPALGVTVRALPDGVHLDKSGRHVRWFAVAPPLDLAHTPPSSTRLRSLLVLTDPRDPPAELTAAVADLTAAVAAAEPPGAAPTAPATTPGRTDSGRKDPGGPPTPGLLPVTWLLLALSLIALPLTIARSRQALVPLAARRWVDAAVVAALAIRIFAPHRLVMVYFGWLHIDQAATLDQVPRYGPATTLLDHAVFALFGASESTVLTLHCFLGSLSIWPLASGVAVATFAACPHAARLATLAPPVFAWTWALLPLAVLDHGSESMLVPAFLWWAGAVALLHAFMATGRRLDLGGAAVLMALCGLSRPDCLIAGPVAAALLVGAPGRVPLDRKRWMPLAIAAALVGLAWLPDLIFLRERTQEDLALGNLPHLGPAFALELPRRFVYGWVALDGRYFPVLATVLALTAVLWPTTRRAAGVLLAAAVVWAVPMLVDFNETSMLRLHAPSAALVLAAAAVGVAAIALDGGRWQRWRLAGAMLAGLLVMAEALATSPAVFARQLSDFDGDFHALVGVHSHDRTPATYVTRTYDDPPSHGIHLFTPNFLLEPGDRWLGVATYLRDPAAVHAKGPVYAVLGVRCHAMLPADRAALPWPKAHPACEALCKEARCTPVIERAVPNLGERAFAWYPPPPVAPTLPVGLYRLERP
jgi:hypothetical protein